MIEVVEHAPSVSLLDSRVFRTVYICVGQRSSDQSHQQALPDADSQELDVCDVSGSQGNIDTTLTPPGTQNGATESNVEKENPSRNAGFATRGNPQQRLMDHS
jgi:hypothetical protein